MRTTLTLDGDVADRLRALARERGLPFKQVVNAVLRRGLHDGPEAPTPFRVDAPQPSVWVSRTTVRAPCSASLRAAAIPV